jgi:uracil-DNA glycosylase family 4
MEGTFMSLINLYNQLKDCTSCEIRKGCTQVVPAIGNKEKPILMIIGEAPGQDEDVQGEPFVGKAGQLLREVLRETNILNRTNSLITNCLKCRPPKNKFPTGDIPSICFSRWLLKEIELAQPKRLLLLGSQALWYVGGMKGITTCRGQWYDFRGIRSLATYHPSYILRQEGEGKTQFRKTFESDIMEVAHEVQKLAQAVILR